MLSGSKVETNAVDELTIEGLEAPRRESNSAGNSHRSLLTEALHEKSFNFLGREASHFVKGGSQSIILQHLPHPTPLLVTARLAPDLLTTSGSSSHSSTSDELINSASPEISPISMSLAAKCQAQIFQMVFEQFGHFGSEIAGPIKLTVKHIYAEDIEVLSMIPKKDSNAAAKSGDIVHPLVIIHHSELFISMRHTVRDSENFGYLPSKVVHIKNIDGIFAGKDNAKYHYLDERRHTEQEPFTLANALVYLPICYGHASALTGDALTKVVDFYLTRGVKQVIIYLGGYNKLTDPVNQLELIGEHAQSAWLAENKENLIKAGVNLVKRADWVLTPTYQAAEKLIEEEFSKKISFLRDVKTDTEEFLAKHFKKPQVKSKSTLRTSSSADLSAGRKSKKESPNRLAVASSSSAPPVSSMPNMMLSPPSAGVLLSQQGSSPRPLSLAVHNRSLKHPAAGPHEMIVDGILNRLLEPTMDEGDYEVKAERLARFASAYVSAFETRANLFVSARGSKSASPPLSPANASTAAVTSEVKDDFKVETTTSRM